LSLPRTKTVIALPYAAAAGPEVDEPPIELHGVHASFSRWRS
jgi:hypothetical protein